MKKKELFRNPPTDPPVGHQRIRFILTNRYKGYLWRGRHVSSWFGASPPVRYSRRTLAPPSRRQSPVSVHILCRRHETGNVCHEALLRLLCLLRRKWEFPNLRSTTQDTYDVCVNVLTPLKCNFVVQILRGQGTYGPFRSPAVTSVNPSRVSGERTGGR